METTSSLRTYDVVIAGGGWAGVYAAQALQRRLGREAARRVALVSDENYLLFQPMLAEVAGSALSPRHVVTPLRRLCAGVDILRGCVRTIDWGKRQLSLDAGPYTRGTILGFKHLVLALGGIVDVSRVAGMAEHAFLMKSVGDALELRTAVLDRLEEVALVNDPAERARLLTFVVVGGGYSGVETAGQLLDLLGGLRRFYPLLRSHPPRVVLVHSGERLLPTLSEGLARYAEKTLRARGLEILLQTRVSAITSNRVLLPDGRSIESHTVVSTVGNAPHPVLMAFARAAGVPLDRGRIVTDAMLRVPGFEGLWAAGDCAAVPLPDGNPAPATAQFAMRQGTLLGNNLAAALRGGGLSVFKFKGLGELAAIGHQRAVAEILGMKFQGFLAWWLWRTVYLSKLPGLERKVRVVLDWTLDVFFPRDFSLFRPGPSTVLQEMHLEKGDVVFRPGEPALSFYIVKNGRIDLRDEQGPVKSLGPGEHFGERALFGDKLWRFQAEAAESTTLVAVQGETFQNFAGASAGFRSALRHTAGRYLSRAQMRELVERVSKKKQGLRAADLMSREVAALRRSQSLAEAFALVRAKGYNSYPLLDDTGAALALISQEDLFEAFQLGLKTVGDLLSRSPEPPSRVREETEVPALLETFFRSGARKLLVEDKEGNLVGILSLLDLLAG